MSLKRQVRTGAMMSEPTQLPSIPDLQASQAERSDAAMLEQSVRGEGTGRSPAGKPPAVHHPGLRITTAAVLIMVVGLALFPGLVGWQASPPEMPDESLALYQYVVGMYPGAPVLVAVDYQPAFTGELETVAGPVLQHLAGQGAHLAFVSTVPTGPLQAERLVEEIDAHSGGAAAFPGGYTNLGYIPGGVTGLRSFIDAPRQTLPQPLSEGGGWLAEPLRNIETLANFTYLIVITDSPETARLWIEQAKSWLGGPPLLMVLSAQAAPLVRPYFEAIPQRVQGMVSGAAGGEAYSYLAGRPWGAQSSWTAFNVGLLAAFVLILAGGAYSVIHSRQAARPEGAAGEEVK